MWYRPKEPCVYILASQRNGTIYIGVTSALYDRMEQHRHGTADSFTRKYVVTQLVYFEMHPTMEDAIQRESQLKKWKRIWKLRLIEQVNPTWIDLFVPGHGIRPAGPGGQSHDR